MNSFNNINNNYKNINMTVQNNDFIQYKNPKNHLRNKIFNFNKNLIYDNFKKAGIEIPLFPKKILQFQMMEIILLIKIIIKENL